MDLDLSTEDQLSVAFRGPNLMSLRAYFDVPRFRPKKKENGTQVQNSPNN
jgi:hypothetical protein